MESSFPMKEKKGLVKEFFLFEKTKQDVRAI